ncbi:MAG: peptidoglycan D,D-transpeptidase FtsI family protein [Acidimicrobiia bacterium]
MNKSIRKLGFVLLLCYGVLFAQLTNVHLVKAKQYNASPINNREIIRDFSVERGTIITTDGVIVADSVPSNDKYDFQRTYPTNDLFAPVTGWFSFLYGTGGVERTYNDQLTGQIAKEQDPGLAALLKGKKPSDVVLTLRSDLQQVAKDALGEREGAVVALDPRSGAILALWSYPTFDPNKLATHDFALARTARAEYEADAAKPLLSGAYGERYFPGSTFKIVTASAGLESGQVTVDAPSYPVTATYTPPLTTNPIRNFGGETCGGTLMEILAVSCNTAFAQMGVDLGPEIMVERSEAFGFNSKPPLDLPSAAVSNFPSVKSFDRNTPALAQSAFGQNDVQASPLQMAMVAGAIANGGRIMAPHVMSEIRDENQQVVQRYQPTVWRIATSPATAAIMRDAMVGVVQRGTATRLSINGVTVAGKTGTAQLGTEKPSSHAWIVGFAPAEEPRVAVAVLIKAQPGVSEVTGGTVAAPVAKAVLENALAVNP